MKSLPINKQQLVTVVALAVLLFATHNLTANPGDWFLLGLNLLDMSAPAVDPTADFAEVVHNSVSVFDWLAAAAKHIYLFVTY